MTLEKVIVKKLIGNVQLSPKWTRIQSQKSRIYKIHVISNYNTTKKKSTIWEKRIQLTFLFTKVKSKSRSSLILSSGESCHFFNCTWQFKITIFAINESESTTKATGRKKTESKNLLSLRLSISAWFLVYFRPPLRECSPRIFAATSAWRRY